MKINDEDYTAIFFSNCHSCPSNHNNNGCIANDSGKCLPEYCPFIFWMKVQQGEI